MATKDERALETAGAAVAIEHDGQTYELVAAGGTRKIRDAELARILGYGRARRVRELIKSHRSSLGEVSPYREAKTSSVGGRPNSGFDLTEEQALFLVAKSETPRATEILKLVIAVFLKAVRGELSAEVAAIRAQLNEVVGVAAGYRVALQEAQRWRESDHQSLVPECVANSNKQQLASLVDTIVGSVDRTSYIWRYTYNCEKAACFAAAGTSVRFADQTWDQAGRAEQWIRSRLRMEVRRLRKSGRRTRTLGSSTQSELFPHGRAAKARSFGDPQ